MSEPNRVPDYAQLPPGGGWIEKVIWGLVGPLTSFLPVFAVLGLGDLGSNYVGEGSVETLGVAFTVAIIIIAAMQGFSCLWAYWSITGEVMYMPRVGRAKKLMAPVGVPVLVGAVVFEIIVALSYGLDALLFIMQSFIVVFISGLFGITFWYRLRKAERTLPRLEDSGQPPPYGGQPADYRPKKWPEPPSRR